jgi:putative flippase GtrA
MIVLNNNKERERFLKFAIVGAIGAVIDFAVMNLLTQTVSLPLVVAGTISFVCAVSSNFIGNRYWTYPDSRSRAITHQLSMFFVVNLAGVAIRIPILHFIEPPLLKALERLQIRGPFSMEFLAKNLTLALAVGIVMLWNYYVNRYWTYNDVD